MDGAASAVADELERRFADPNYAAAAAPLANMTHGDGKQGRHPRAVAAMLLTAAALLSSTSSYADEDEKHHGGFFFRGELGGGYLASSEPTRTAALGDVTISGPAGFGGSSFGGAVAENLILAAHFSGGVAVNPGVSTTSGLSGQTSNASLNSWAIGPELAYFFMPANVYLSGTVAVTSFSSTVNNVSTPANTGWGFQLALGKDWWTSDKWGIGLAAQLLWASNQDTGPGASAITTIGYGLVLSAAFSSATGVRAVAAKEKAKETSVAAKEADEPEVAPQRSLETCGQAFDQYDALAAAWIEGTDRQVRTDRPTRVAFLDVCGNLDEKVQDCLVAYAKTHREACESVFDALGKTERSRLDWLFLEPQPKP